MDDQSRVWWVSFFFVRYVAARHRFKRDDWFNDSRLINFTKEVDALNKAKMTLQRQNKPLATGRIIAELNFGFWTSLLDRRYEQVLWPWLLKAAFPFMPRRMRTRKNLSKRFHTIRYLRNRIFHHKPVWYWCDLPQQHQAILEAIAWIEPAARDLTVVIDRFPAVHQPARAQ